MHEIKMMKLETDVIMVESVEPVLNVVVATTSIVLVLRSASIKIVLKKTSCISCILLVS